jgi:hypothetical protein
MRGVPLRGLLAPAVLAVLIVGGCRTPGTPVRQPGVRLEGVTSIEPNTHFATLGGLGFGGVSGVVYDAARGELVGICDESAAPRVFRMRIDIATLRVEPVSVIRLEQTDRSPSWIDGEGIAILPDGHLLIASEGGGAREPYVPPAILEYTADGGFVGDLPLPPQFVPSGSGAQARGVRHNEAFESLTLAAGAARLFTGTESALAQDGEAASFDHGALSRLIEYEWRGDRFVPSRQYVYPVDAIARPPFTPGTAINGLVELLALDDGDLLALERSFVEDAGRPGHGENRIRLFRVTLAGATDVSALPSLRGTSPVPVAKRLVLDLASVAGLPPALAASLDNFEALALLPGRGGRQSLLLVSDDNFSPVERTWFVKVGIR